MFLHFLKMLAPLTALLEIACASDGRALREVVPLFEERGARGGPDEAERLGHASKLTLRSGFWPYSV
jgi:hypothetical protein